MILVVGGTGNIGSLVVKQLQAGKHAFRVLARDPAKVSKLGADAVQGDLSQPESVVKAMQGADRAFILSAGMSIVAHDAVAIAAAKKAGIKHVVLLSVMSADKDGAGTGPTWHRKGEDALRATGMQWTMLRPGAFMSNTLGWAPTIKAAGSVFSCTGDGQQAPIDPADIAACAVAGLTQDKWTHQGFTLTGPELLSVPQQVEILAKATGKPIKCVEIPASTHKENLLKHGLPAGLVDVLMEYFVEQRAGHSALMADGVEKMLGRKPTTFASWAEKNAAAY